MVPDDRNALRSLTCGNIEVQFDTRDGQLQHLRCAGIELLRGINASLRDENWDTVPPTLSEVEFENKFDSFAVRFKARHRAPGIDFKWDGRIRIEGSTSALVYEFTGQALATFRRNRIGFCVLHGAGLSGAPLEVQSTEEDWHEGIFPDAISPQQPFKNLRVIRHQVSPGLKVMVRMEGDTFEMEDQRNWTDASYKTYCTPLDLPFPVEIQKGERISQRIEVSWTQEATTLAPLLAVPVVTSETTLLAPASEWCILPQIGFGASAPGSNETLATLGAGWRSLHAAHLRVDLRGEDAEMDRRLEAAAQEVQALDTGLEVAIFAGESDLADDFDRVSAALRRAGLAAKVCRWLVFSSVAKTTPIEVLRAARAALADLSPAAKWGAGTDAYFAELNRADSPATEADVVTFSINPQVHAFDDNSMLETMAMHEVVVRDASRKWGERPVVVSPVTLRPRFNPNATAVGENGAEGDPDIDPATIDPRQQSDLAAVWTLGSFGYLMRGGATAVTYYRLTGPAGIADGATWFPVGRLFQALGEFQGGQGLWLESANPTLLFGLHLSHQGRHRMLVANASRRPIPTPRIEGLPPGVMGRVVTPEPRSPEAPFKSDSMPGLSVVSWDWADPSATGNLRIDCA